MIRIPICLVLVLFMGPFAVFAQGPASVEKDLLASLKLIDQFGTYGGNFQEERLDVANDALKSVLLKQGKRFDILKYGFPNLKKEMRVVTSPDGRLRIYTWDTQTGGTMHFYDCVIQYQGLLSNNVFARHCTSDGLEDPGAFYSQIAQADIPLGRVYLANSTFIGDGMDHGQSIELFGISGDALGNPKFIRTTKGLTNTISFAYSPFTIKEGVYEDALVTFAQDGRSFSFPVVVEDKDSGTGRITNRFITYRFNGKYFVKAS
jgi:hypothetical protein